MSLPARWPPAVSDVGDKSLSPAQQAAVRDPRPQVLVAAAAGSGKTKLLVAAVVKALVDEQLPVERLVAVTFTRKAGAELASRVREALEACGRVDLARALDSASVGTIDSLCRRLVKDQALTVGVDPACAVLEAGAAELVKREVIDRIWGAVVEQADETTLEVLAAQGKNLCEDVVALYDRLRSLGQEEPRITVPVGRSEKEARARLTEALKHALAAGAADPKPSASLAADLDKSRACLDWLEGPPAEREGDAALRASAGFFPTRRTPGMEGHLEPMRSALTAYRCVLAEARLRPLADVVNTLLAEFHRLYTARKSEHGLVDFADLELKARALVTQAASDARVVGPLYGSYLLVDEFQDTNELQCAILGGLGAERMLMVGDERQSIYRFRGADVDVFKKRRRALASGESPGQPGGLHRLDVNYRSTPEILAFVNGLFSHRGLFGEDFALLAPDPDRVAVRPGGAPAVATAPAARVEVLVAERRREGEGDGRSVPMQQAEAEALAAHVRGMLDHEGWRQRDIVVLLPTQTQVELYKHALDAQRVTAYLVRGKGYYTQEEVIDVICLLRLLLNPHDDLAMVSALRSPLVGLSDDGLYLLGRERRVRRARSLWDVVRGKGVEVLSAADRDALALFVERTGQIRPRVGRPGLARLIDDAISAFSYDLCLLAAPEGGRRFANVRKLMRLAEEFELATGPDLAAFLAAVKSTGQVSDREGSAPTLGEGDDVVRVMTVHQAKGLEFPVVVLAGLGADAHRPGTSTFAVGSDGRVGLFLKGYRNQTYEPYDPCWGPAAEIAVEEVLKEQEEDVRLLYVAMTRAQERLVLVGARPAKDAMDKSRIGRIVSALGLSTFPASGEVARVEGLSAKVVGVEPVPVAAHSEGAPEAEMALSAVVSAAPEPGSPQFLELPSASSAPTRVSFSALAAYKRCPRRFYLERVLRVAVAEPSRDHGEADPDSPHEPLLDAEEEHAGRDTGILVHRLLEQSAASSVRPEAETVRAAAAAALSELGLRLSAQEIERAVALTLAVWDSPAADRLGLVSAAREVPFFYAVGGTVVSGIMDLLCREPGCWSVTDYKTNALRGRPIAEVAEPYALQCAVYGLAALRAGASAVQMDLLFLESPSELVSVRYDTGDAARLEKELVELLSGLQQDRFPRQEGKSCEHCPVVAVCATMVVDQAMV
jgi:ATP-dependent helicase/nuclease subunit A